jgi:hypothetical protein
MVCLLLIVFVSAVYVLNEAPLAQAATSTFGYTTIGTVNGGEPAANEMYGVVLTTGSDAESATLNSVTWAGNNFIYPQIYSNVKAVLVSYPDKQIIAISNSVQIDYTDTWHTNTFSSPPVLYAETQYVLMLIGDSAFGIDGNTGTTSILDDPSNSYSSPVNPTGTFSSSSFIYSIYGTYTLPQTFSGGVMPSYGYGTSFTYDIDVSTASGGGINVNLVYSGNVVASSTISVSTNGENSGTVYLSSAYFVIKGNSYSIELVPVDECTIVNTVNSLYLTYSPYYLIAVSSYLSGVGNMGYSISSAVEEGGNYYAPEGGDYTVSVTTPQNLGIGTQAVCVGYTSDVGSGSGASVSVTNVAADHTFTFNWQLQYQVTFSVTGLDSSAQGTVVTVDGVNLTFSSLPYTKWFTSGSQTTFTFTTTILSSTTGKEFKLTSSYSSPQTITGTTTLVDGYSTYYYLTVNSAYGSPLYADWYLAGSTAYCGVTPTTVSTGTGVQEVFTSWSGSGSGSYTGTNTMPAITMNAPITETAVWQLQYYLTVNGVYSTSYGSGWYDYGATAYFNVSSPITSGGGQTSFTSWSGSGSGSYSGTTNNTSCTMNSAITETANWGSQYLLTIVSPYGTTTGAGWYTSGATAYAGLVSGTVSGGSGTQYVFTGWSSGGTDPAQSTAITMDNSYTVTATWSTQYYLTVSSAYGTTSGYGWYNSGSYTTASVSSSLIVDSTGTHTLQGWGGDANGGGITSNSILMSSSKNAVASWTTTGGSSGGSANYTVTLHGIYYDDSSYAQQENVKYTLTYANGTIFSAIMNSTAGNENVIVIHSTSPFVQLTWNASSTANYTRIYRFMNTTNDDIRLYIVDPNLPSSIYSFSVTDFSSMKNPFLETSVSPDGNHTYVVERADLSDSGGTVTFVMNQNQIYTLTFIQDITPQLSFSQTFTASISGVPGTTPISLDVLAGDFPTSNGPIIMQANADRNGSNTIIVSYFDPSGNTSWVYVKIYHLQGSIQIIDYVVNSTGNSQSFLWQLADSKTSYLVNVQSYSGNQLYTWNLSAPASSGSSNPFLGLLDWLGQSVGTLPHVQTGWPTGMTSAQIGEIIAACIVMMFLCIGSFRSAGACCVLSWIIFGLMLWLGWMGVVSIYTIPQFAFSGFLAIVILLDEAKSQARET